MMRNLDFDLEELKKHYIVISNCVVCGDTGDTWFTMPESDILQCKSCEFVWVENRMGPEGAKIYYNSYKKSEHFLQSKVDDRKVQYSQDVKFVNDIIASHIESDSISILDVGCSDGSFTKLLADEGRELYGTELNLEVIQMARNNAVDVRTSLDEFEDNKFDVIVMRGVVQHITDIDKYFENFSRVLKENGLVFAIATPNIKSFCAQVYKDKWVLFDHIAHIFYFDPSTIEKFFNKHSFDLIKYEFPYCGTVYEDMKSDYDKIISDIRAHEINNISPAFWGNMMSSAFINKKGNK